MITFLFSITNFHQWHNFELLNILWKLLVDKLTVLKLFFLNLCKSSLFLRRMHGMIKCHINPGQGMNCLKKQTFHFRWKIQFLYSSLIFHFIVFNWGIPKSDVLGFSFNFNLENLNSSRDHYLGELLTESKSGKQTNYNEVKCTILITEYSIVKNISIIIWHVMLINMMFWEKYFLSLLNVIYSPELSVISLIVLFYNTEALAHKAESRIWIEKIKNHVYPSKLLYQKTHNA